MSASPTSTTTTCPSVGPGWEYYLDRLVAAETGGDPATVDFDRDYYPAMAEHYRAERDATALTSSIRTRGRPGSGRGS